MQTFELLGGDEDETRLLRATACGYSIALAGHPRVAPAPEGRARYDVVVALGDLAVHHGFRVDRLAMGADPQAIAVVLATGYRDLRATGPEARVKRLPFRPEWMLGGADVIYGRRDQPEPLMEQVWVMLRASPTGLWALYHTTWFKTADVDALRWAHLRASFIDQHAWDGKPRDTSPTIWPPSEITLPSAKLNLTETAWRIAAGKAADIGHLTSEQVQALVGVHREFSQSDFPPRAPVPILELDTLRMRLTQFGPTQAATILLSDLDACKTRHDLHGWAWQCVWSIANGAELG